MGADAAVHAFLETDVLLVIHLHQWFGRLGHRDGAVFRLSSDRRSLARVLLRCIEVLLELTWTHILSKVAVCRIGNVIVYIFIHLLTPIIQIV